MSCHAHLILAERFGDDAVRGGVVLVGFGFCRFVGGSATAYHDYILVFVAKSTVKCQALL